MRRSRSRSRPAKTLAQDGAGTAKPNEVTVGALHTDCYKAIKHEYKKLRPAAINRELSLLRRAYQLGYQRKPQLVEKIPPIKKLAENNVRQGFFTPE